MSKSLDTVDAVEPLKTPLLERRDSAVIDTTLVDAEITFKTHGWAEAKELFGMAWQVILSYVFQLTLSMISLAFVGRLGDNQMAGAALGNTFSNVTGFSILVGLSSGVETLAAQNFGAKRYKQVGVVVQRGLVVAWISCIPIALIWFFSEDILRAAGQPEDAIPYSGQFNRILLIGLFPEACNQILLKYLHIQGIVTPQLVVAFVVNMLHIPLNYLLIYTFDFGFIGAPLATAISFWLLPTLTLSYVLYNKIYERTWDGVSSQAFENLKQYMALATPGAVMTCFEWWTFEVITLMAGIMGVLETDAQSVCFNAIAFCFMFPLGVGIAASARVGNALGRGRPKQAKLSTWVSLLVICAIEGVAATILISLRYHIPLIFTEADDVVDMAAGALPVVASFEFLDGFQGVVSGVLRGSGRQAIGAFSNFFAYYVLGLPLAYVFAFLWDLKVVGLNLGLTVGLFIQSCIFMVIMMKTNWHKQSDMAIDRARATVDGYGDTASGFLDDTADIDVEDISVKAAAGDHRGSGALPYTALSGDEDVRSRSSSIQ
eukprot:GFYU01003507.1.p1 GENE.GFYU01003507.1~~GFYU01003507.1.p1  ORF type:complete len:545 (-),score=160.83 GFYU01003507.1:43-1677(-)